MTMIFVPDLRYAESDYHTRPISPERTMAFLDELVAYIDMLKSRIKNLEEDMAYMQRETSNAS